MITEEILKSIKASVLCWLATAGEKGEPNVSPKEMFVPCANGSILIANIASPISVQNIQYNPSVCVSFIDIFKQKGYKLKGSAIIIKKSDSDFTYKKAQFRNLGGDRFPIKNIIEVTPNAVEPILAPSYYFFPNTTEQAMVEHALAAYGVKSATTQR